MDKIYNLIVDTKLKTYQKVYGMKQFENNVVLNIQLVQNGTPLDLTGCTVRLNYQNKNEVLLQMANIIDETKGKVRVTVLTKVLDTIGDTPVDISVFDSNQRKITSSTFVLVVQESIYNNDKIDEEELDLIQGIFTKEKERQQAENERKDNESKRISDESERVSNELSRENKEKERQANELERIENENLRKTNEQQRVKQENKREENEVVRVTGEDTRVKSMEKIQSDWEVIKNDLNNLEGGGDMMKSIYDTNKNGIVDDSEKLGGVAADKFLQKQNKTTWNELNTQDKNVSGVTEHLKFNRPSVDDEIQLAPFTENFTKLDTVLHRMGTMELPTFNNIYIDSLQTPGRYLVIRPHDAPDIPPIDSRFYIITVTCVSAERSEFFYEIDSLGTGKKYTYRNKQFTEIPTRSALQPEDIYIDPKNGSDANDGSKDHPILTWSCMVSRLPKILSKPLTINILNDINDPVTLCNYRYCGDNASTTKLKINGNGHSINTLDLINNNLTGATYGIYISTLDAIRIRCYECSSTFITSCDVDTINSENTPIQCASCKVRQYVADVNTVMIINGHKTPDELSTYGCVAYFGSLIFVRGSKPTGSGGDKLTGTGGRVEYED